ncbi:MAG: hypothetical protein WAV20_05875 [Blastocatellia bacterium]
MSVFSVLLMTFLSLAPMSSMGRTAIHSAGQDNGLVVLRGRAVCLDSGDRPVDPLFGCKETNNRFGFASKDGRLYKFLATDIMTAVFTDTRVREREIQLTARLQPGSQLEIIKVQSVKAGKIYDIYYFCEVCNIRAYVQGLCPCCRNELEFRETPP